MRSAKPLGQKEVGYFKERERRECKVEFLELQTVAHFSYLNLLITNLLRYINIRFPINLVFETIKS